MAALVVSIDLLTFQCGWASGERELLRGTSVQLHGIVMLDHPALISTNPRQKEHFFPGSFHDDIVGNS